MKTQFTNTAIDAQVSVAMATYNGEKYIREQLESIARQTLLPAELVITDDGSTDATLQIAEEFAGAAPFPVRIFRNESRLGYADNFLKAASLCQGDLIAFCDQDDVWMDTKLSTCSNFFSNPDVLLVIHSAKIKANANTGDPFYPQFERTKLLESANPISNLPGFAMVIRSSLLHFASPVSRPGRINGHDQWAWFLAASAGCIVTVADALALYRQHGENVFGAPRHISVAANLQRVGGTLNYDELADSELECARVLYRAAEKSLLYAGRLKKTAEKFEVRSRRHRLRTQIYRKDSTPWSRARAFLTILLNAGYLPDSSKSRLGPRAAAKDLLFGVSGAFRFTASTTDVTDSE